MMALLECNSFVSRGASILYLSIKWAYNLFPARLHREVVRDWELINKGERTFSSTGIGGLSLDIGKQTGSKASVMLLSSLRSFDTSVAASGRELMFVFCSSLHLLYWGLNYRGTMTTELEGCFFTHFSITFLLQVNNLAVSGGRSHTFQKNRELLGTFCYSFNFVVPRKNQASQFTFFWPGEIIKIPESEHLIILKNKCC